MQLVGAVGGAIEGLVGVWEILALAAATAVAVVVSYKAWKKEQRQKKKLEFFKHVSLLSSVTEGFIPCFLQSCQVDPLEVRQVIAAAEVILSDDMLNDLKKVTNLIVPQIISVHMKFGKRFVRTGLERGELQSLDIMERECMMEVSTLGAKRG